MKQTGPMIPSRYLYRVVLPLALISGSLFFSGSLFHSCHPERSYVDDADAKLAFTLDTVFFDTVFTTLGTVTKSFRIKNPHNQFVKIDEITLAGGSSSVFRVNVDGMPGIRFTAGQHVCFRGGDPGSQPEQ